MNLVPRFRNELTRRQLTAFPLLVVSLLMIFPISIRSTGLDSPTNALGKDTTVPFPCQNRPCGCKSAKQCWKKCCCFSQAQKLAWAKSQGVKPPAFIIPVARQEQAAGGSPSRATEECCIAKKPVPRPRVRIVVGIEALQCQGVEESTMGLLISVKPPEAANVVDTNHDTGEYLPIQEFPPAPFDLEPPTPPPRLALA